MKFATKVIPIWITAVELKEWAIRNQIDHILVHSCADAAYVVSLCRRLGGPPYSLRLGGDLDTYGV